MSSSRINIPPIDSYRLLKRDATAIDVAKSMREVIQEVQTDPLLQTWIENIRCMPGKTIDNIATETYHSVNFEPDTVNQRIRTPRRTITDRRGNCVDLTVLIASIAYGMGLPVTIRIVKLPGRQQFTHVYPLVNGIPVDCVIGQSEDGISPKAPAPTIGVEVPHKDFMDFHVN